MRPSEYNISIHFDPRLKPGSSQGGRVRIGIVSDIETDSIVLHFGPNLLYLESSVRLYGEEAIYAQTSVSLSDFAKQIVHLSVRNASLQKDTAYTLEITYKWTVARGNRGPYNNLAKEGYYLLTQFQPIDFRNFVPGFDEPRYKAVFALEVTIPKETRHMVEIRGNTKGQEANKEESGEREILYRFPPTPKMSSYIFALVIFDPSRIRRLALKKAGFEVEEFGGVKNYGMSQLRETAESWVTSLQLTEEYTGIKSVMRKYRFAYVRLHHYGGMENWGLITARRNRSSLILHEAIHMWIGNLVTMEDLRDLWLNEAFTEFLTNIMLHHLPKSPQDRTTRNCPYLTSLGFWPWSTRIHGGKSEKSVTDSDVPNKTNEWYINVKIGYVTEWLLLP